jgi:hypothetical protein
MAIPLPKNLLLPATTLITCLFFGTLLEASTTGQEPTVNQDPSANRQAKEDPQEDVAPNSFIDGILQNPNTTIGFSLGSYYVYAGDKTRLVDRPRVITFGSLQPRVFTQRQFRRSTLRLDYAFGYRSYGRNLDFRSSEHTGSFQFDRRGQRAAFRLAYDYGSTNYNGQPGLDSSGHSASVRLNLTLTRNTSLELSDSARRTESPAGGSSSFNDNGFQLSERGFVVDSNGFNSFNQNIYLGTERVTANIATARWSYRWSERGTLGLFSSYESNWYKSQTWSDSQALQVGISGSYQLSRWISFSSGYSTYLGTVDEQLRTGSIQELRMGGFRYKTRPGIELFGAAGLEHSMFRGVNQTTASFQGGVYKNAGAASFELSYHRGFSKVSGLGAVLQGDDANAAVKVWLSRRMSVQAGSYYVRGNTGGSSSLNSISGYGSIGIAVHAHLLLSTQYSYLSQRSRNVSSGLPDAERYAVSAGLQYFLPNLYRR